MEVLARIDADEQSDLETLRLVVAISQYELKHGRAPNTLSELVPSFLDSIPPGLPNGRRFRYTPGTLTVSGEGEEVWKIRRADR